MAVISVVSPANAAAVANVPNATASTMACPVARFASVKSRAPKQRPTRAVAPALTITE